MFGRRARAETSVVALPSTTSEPPGCVRRATLRAMRSTSTQSAMSPKKPITSRGRYAIDSGITVVWSSGPAEVIVIDAVADEHGPRVELRLRLQERLGRDDHQVGPAEEALLLLG